MDAVLTNMRIGLARLCVPVLLCMLLAPAVSAEPARVMPKAMQSLLLDITDVGARLVAVGDRGHVLYQDSPEDEWQQAPVPVRQMLTSLCFSGPDRGWAVGYDAVVVATVDGGRSWHDQYLGLTYQFAFNQQLLTDLISKKNTLTASLAVADTDVEVNDLRNQLEDLALDIGDAQDALAEPVHTPPLFDVYCQDSLNAYAVGAFGIFVYTQDGGVNWHRDDRRIPNPGQYHLNAITGDAGNLLWIVGEGGLMFHSDDKGLNWQQLESPYEGSLFGIQYHIGRSMLLVYGLQGNAFVSADGGVSWIKSQTEGNRSFAGGVWFNADYVMLVGGVGNVQLSRNGGLNFDTVPFPGRANLSAVAVRNGRATAVGLGGIYRVEELVQP
ncbi:MAG: YCF48-related protein [Halioglobus sp.]